MAASKFIINSERSKVIKVQYRKLQDDFRDAGLGVDGPYMDRRNAVAELSEEVRLRMRKGVEHPVAATIATIGPQNVPTSDRSWLKTPFILSSKLVNERSCAGEIATARASESDKTPCIAVDLEALSVLAVAVLRRMEIPSFLAYVHFDENNPAIRMRRAIENILGNGPGAPCTPCILAFDKNTTLFSFIPPYTMDFPAPGSVKSLEILDDEAVKALLMMRTAHLQTMGIMRSVKESVEDFPDERRVRAMAIGHLLHAGTEAWSLKDAGRDVRNAAQLIGKDHRQFESVREIAEDELVHPITCCCITAWRRAT
jgi:hypothetical protein